jgi:polar amino acid transport system ATP-binding protein
MVFQSFNLFPQYTALENVTLAKELHAKREPDFKANKKDIKGTVQKLEVEIAKSRFSSKNTSIKIPLELDWRKLNV